VARCWQVAHAQASGSGGLGRGIRALPYAGGSAGPLPNGRRPRLCPALPGNLAIQPCCHVNAAGKRPLLLDSAWTSSGNTRGCASFNP
jgi:hypothetical protein